MRLTKTQQEVYDSLMLLLRQRGRAWLLGWALGMIIQLAQHDPNLRRSIKRKLEHDDRA